MSALTERIERAVNPLPDHQALIECRRENGRVHTQLRDEREARAVQVALLRNDVEQLLALVTRMQR